MCSFEIYVQAFSGLHTYLTEFKVEKSLVLSCKVRQLSHSLAVNGGRMRLPALTVRNLELFEFRSKGQRSKTLFGLLDRTVTKFGRRMMR